MRRKTHSVIRKPAAQAQLAPKSQGVTSHNPTQTDITAQRKSPPPRHSLSTSVAFYITVPHQTSPTEQKNVHKRILRIWTFIVSVSSSKSRRSVATHSPSKCGKNKNEANPTQRHNAETMKSRFVDDFHPYAMNAVCGDAKTVTSDGSSGSTTVAWTADLPVVEVRLLVVPDWQSRGII